MRKLVRTALIVLGVLTVLFCTAMLAAASVWPTINRVETGKSLEYDHLLPKTYQLGYDRVYDEARAAVQEQPGWTLLSEDRAQGLIQARTGAMPVTGWTFQVTTRVERRSEFAARVYVTSEGSDAPGDLGQNARNIEGLLASVDQRLGASAVP